MSIFVLKSRIGIQEQRACLRRKETMLSETGTIMQNTCEYRPRASPTEVLSETGVSQMRLSNKKAHADATRDVSRWRRPGDGVAPWSLAVPVASAVPACLLLGPPLHQQVVQPQGRHRHRRDLDLKRLVARRRQVDQRDLDIEWLAARRAG